MQAERGTSAVVAIHGCILGALLLFSVSYQRLGLAAESLTYPLCVLLVIVSVWSIWSWKSVTTTVFDPCLLFFISALLFNGGQAFLEVFGLNERGLLNNMFVAETTVQSLLLIIVGLAALHFGALLSVVTGRPTISGNQTLRNIDIQSVRIVGWSFLLVSLLPTLVIFRNAASVVVSTGYMGLYQQDSTTSFDAAPKIIATFLAPAALFLLAGSPRQRSGMVVSGMTMLCYAVLQLFIGVRGAAVMPLIAYAWLWHRKIRPLPASLLLSLGAILLLVVFPLIRVTRNGTGTERSSTAYLVNAYTSLDNPAIAIISEMGTSMVTVAYTIDLVPSYRDFDHGAGYVYALLTAVPNVLGGLHPTIARGLPSEWLIWTVDPYTAALGGSLGFSFIAEAYLNFGWIGTPLFLALLGFLFGRFSAWGSKTSDPAKGAMVASFLAFFLFFARQEAASQVRFLLWYALIPYLCVYAVRIILSKSNQSNRDITEAICVAETFFGQQNRS